MDTKLIINSPIIKHIGELCNTPITIIATESGAGAPVLLQNLIEQNKWKIKFKKVDLEWFDLSELEDENTVDIDFTIYVFNDILPSATLNEPLNLFLPEPEKDAYIQHCLHEYFNQNYEIFRSIESEIENNKVIILTTKNLAPIFNKAAKDNTLIVCEHPILTISVEQKIEDKTITLYEKYPIR